MDNKLFNTSGCKDMTAYAAIKNVQRDEKKKLIEELKAYAEKYGYKIVGIVRLEEFKEL
jgi:hypothetical protein